MPPQLTRADISIRVIPGWGAERAFMTGAAGTGKSTGAEVLIKWFVEDYQAQKCMVLVADTKPRFRAERHLNGMDAKHLYKRWDHGPVMKGSYLLDLNLPGDNYGIDAARKLGARVVIAQSSNMKEWPVILDVIDRFFKQARASRPQLLVIDELADFYSVTGHVIRGADYDSIRRTARAGRELGLAGIFETQRPSGVPVSIKTEMSKAFVYRLDYEKDMDTMRDLGLPPGARPPDEDYVCYFFSKRLRVGRYIKFDVPHGTQKTAQIGGTRA